MNTINQDVVIVGAGLTGLYLGQLLKLQGKSCLILEKSKGLGGRVATRRIDELGLDHGALYLSFLNEIQPELKQANLAWIQTNQGDFISGGMNSLSKALGKNLEVCKSQKVQNIVRINNRWHLETEEGQHYSCGQLVITAPVPQALELLAKNSLSPSSSHSVFNLHYSKAIMLLVTFTNLENDHHSIDFEGHQFHLMRERNLHPRGLVLQLSSTLAEKLFEETDELILKELFDVLGRSTFSKIPVEKFELKKWRYSRPLSIFNAPYLEVQADLYLCGDGFASPFASSQALASQL